jgi:DNA-binding transcriptional LysR family regulator
MNARNIGWDNLKVFLATAREGTLAAAASTLSMDPSTVHRRIAALETDLATRLFDRSQQGYALTQAGEELLDHVAVMENEVLGIGRNVAGRDQRLSGTVRLATVDDLAFSLLPAILHDFRQSHRGVGVHLDVRSEFADLDRLQADVAIRFGTRPQSGRVVSRRVSRVATYLYASAEYLAAKGRPRSPQDLAAHDIVRGDERMSRLVMEIFIENHASASKTAFRSNSMLSRLAAVRAGMGVGFLSAFVADPDPSLERIGLDIPALTESVWMVIHADIRRNARVRAFADYTYDRLVMHRDRFDPA